MTRIDHDRAKTRDVVNRLRRNAWAYACHSESLVRKGKDYWLKVRTKEKIRALDARIRSGRNWVMITPLSDPRRALYLRKIEELLSERARLVATLDSL